MKCITLFLMFVLTAACCLAQKQKGVLHIIVNASKDEYGYANSKGDTVIPMGKYPMCYTNLFDNFAIVLINGKGFVGIDRNENILFQVYPFDNGLDEPACRLFRIVKDGKIGYADLQGKIVIEPKFDCACPFKNNKAEVGLGCIENKNGEHHFWSGGVWHAIDEKGKTVKKS